MGYSPYLYGQHFQGKSKTCLNEPFAIFESINFGETMNVTNVDNFYIQSLFLK
jgi:hypothetical protein